MNKQQLKQLIKVKCSECGNITPTYSKAFHNQPNIHCSKCKQTCKFEKIVESKDYSSPYDSAGILDVIHDIDDDVYKEIIKLLAPEEKEEFSKNRRVEFLAPDGGDAFQIKGTINLYLRGIPPRLWSNVGNKVKEELTKLNVRLTSNRWKNVDKSKLIESDVLRFDVLLPQDMTLADLKRAYHFQGTNEGNIMKKSQLKAIIKECIQEAIMGFIPSQVSPQQQKAMDELESQGYRFANWYAGEPDAEGESDVGVAVMIKKSGPSRLYKEVEPNGAVNESTNENSELKENDSDDYEMRKWQSGINKFNKTNTQRYPCPTCKKENALSAWQKKQGYQCDACADSEEGVYESVSMQLKDILNEITISRNVNPTDKELGVTGYISSTVKCKGCAKPTNTLRINSDGKEVVACCAKCSDMVGLHHHL
jgi:ribosomal protein S27E